MSDFWKIVWTVSVRQQSGRVPIIILRKTAHLRRKKDNRAINSMHTQESVFSHSIRNLNGAKQ